jgi:3-deoxy-7-phosphoheptulonate synthase
MTGNGMSLEEATRQLEIQRNLLGGVDDSIVRALADRERLVREIGVLKSEHDIGRFDPSRESLVFKVVEGLATQYSNTTEFPSLIREVFALAVSYSHFVQRDEMGDGKTPALEKLISDLTGLRIMEPKRFITPREVKARYPLTEKAGRTTLDARNVIHNILEGDDKRLLLIAGPCSIDDPKAAIEYAGKLKELADDVKDDIYIVMRTYFEKPRTQLGWKGFLLDPDRDGSYDIEKGHLEARKLLREINEMGMPCGTEFLGLLTPQYVDDLISWFAIGARTVESQPHREMASGLSMPGGFKNSTYGDEQVAIDAIIASRGEHYFVGGDIDRNYAIMPTTGNPDTHIILRGGNGTPNYGSEAVQRVIRLCEEANGGIRPNIMIDCSHANSGKDHLKQPDVFMNVVGQKAEGTYQIIGTMLESNLYAGNQKIDGDKYGVSRTDKCMDWDTTNRIVRAGSDLLRASRLGEA